jgi:hypothetical protein
MLKKRNIYNYLLCFTVLLSTTASWSQKVQEEIISGELEHIIEDDFDNETTRDLFYIKDEKTNKIHKLEFGKGKIPDELLSAPSGSKVKMRAKKGTQIGASILADEGEVAFDVVTFPSNALKGVKKILAVRINFLDRLAVHDNEATVYKHLLDPNNSVSSKNFFIKNSQNNFDITGEVVSVKINVRAEGNTSCSTSLNSWVSEAKSLLTTAGYSFSNYTNIQYYIPPNVGCPFAGRAGLGGSYSYIAATRLKTISHELGHNFGLHHASDASYEYGDRSDSMGVPTSLIEFNAPHKYQLGWLPVEKVKEITGNGTFRVAPLNSDSGSVSEPQLYRIKIGTSSRYYYISFRDKGDVFDALLTTTYADRLNIHSFVNGMNRTMFENALNSGGSHQLVGTDYTLKVDSINSNYIQFSISGGSGSTADTTAPSVSLTSPSNGSSFNAGSTVTASASASDNVGVTKVEFYLNNSLKCTDTSSHYSCSFSMPTGSNLPLKAKAYDAAGNSKESSIVYISSNSVDTTAPSVSITSPGSGSSFDENSSVTALASASDNVGVTKVEFYLNNSLKCTDSSSPYSCSFSMPSGSNLPLKAKAYDAAGNSKESAIISISSKSSSVDTEKPVIKITSPASGSEHDADSTITVNFQASDNVGINRLYCYGVSGWQMISNSASSCQVKLPSTAGDYTVRVYASDAARNYVYADLPLKIKAATTVDTEKPVIKITSPASGSEHDADSMVTLNFQASDNVGIVRQYCYGASGWVSIGANASSCQVKMPASGDLAAKVYAIDASSNYSIEEIALKVKTEVTVDTEKPVITITSPTDGSEHEASSVVTINFEATDNVGIKSLYCYTPTGWKSVPLVKPYKCDVQMPASGDFRTRVWAYDTSMNANDRYLLLKMKEEVTVDTEKPVINITSPAAGSKHPADSMVTINFTATDNVGVERIYCYGASGWEMQSSTARSCQVRMPASGDFSARVYASDAANNYAMEYLSLTVGSSTEVDTEKPVVKILSPSEWAHYAAGSLVTIKFEATDNVEIQSLYCYSSDGWRRASLTKPYSCQIKMPASGNFRTRVWAYDTSKNYDYQWLNLYGE